MNPTPPRSVFATGQNIAAKVDELLYEGYVNIHLRSPEYGVYHLTGYKTPAPKRAMTWHGFTDGGPDEETPLNSKTIEARLQRLERHVGHLFHKDLTVPPDGS